MTTFITPATKDLIRYRDEAFARLKVTEDQDDKQIYHNLKNRVHKEMSRDKKAKDTDKLAEIPKTIKKHNGTPWKMF